MNLPIFLSKCLLCDSPLKDMVCYNCCKFIHNSMAIYLYVKPFEYKLKEFSIDWDYCIFRHNGTIYSNYSNGSKLISSIDILENFSDIFDHINKIRVFQ